MKKQITMLALTTALLASSVTANAASIPRETAPQNATEEQIQIVENLIGGYLDEIQADAGYGMITSYANTKIYKAVFAGQVEGSFNV